MVAAVRLRLGAAVQTKVVGGETPLENSAPSLGDTEIRSRTHHPRGEGKSSSCPRSLKTVDVISGYNRSGGPR